MVCVAASKPCTTRRRGFDSPWRRQRLIKTSGLIGLLTLVLATHADEPALPSAHVHGQATLTVAVEGKALEIHLDSAAMNLLGFEHRANSQAEKRRLTALRKELDDVQQRLQLQGGQCRLREQWTNIGERFEPGSDEHRDGTHRDIEARYRFHCERPSTLRGLRTDLLSKYPALNSLSVQWLVGGRQGALTLDNSRDNVSFR